MRLVNTSTMPALSVAATDDFTSLARNHHSKAATKHNRLRKTRVSLQLYPVRGMMMLLVARNGISPPTQGAMV